MFLQCIFWNNHPSFKESRDSPHPSNLCSKQTQMKSFLNFSTNKTKFDIISRLTFTYVRQSLGSYRLKSYPDSYCSSRDLHKKSTKAPTGDYIKQWACSLWSNSHILEKKLSQNLPRIFRSVKSRKWRLQQILLVSLLKSWYLRKISFLFLFTLSY